MDLEVSPALTIPTSELGWRFSRSSGPGGQHVNTSDSRVELSWDVAGSAALSDDQRQQLVTRLGPRLIAGVITVTASEQRSQLRNREIALAKLSRLVAEGLLPSLLPAGRANPPGARSAGTGSQRNTGRRRNNNENDRPPINWLSESRCQQPV
ncbi:peptidyl-tRNA hydrolase ICT1, mitochondrial [Arthrobacter sp. Hiyo8]|nr:peptidyl-tRNA hydrolase ICT1, mitochondrial [Arthrobacter sp. Hiyo8]